MILLVDVGNTRIKWLVWADGEALQRGHLFHRGIAPGLLGERLWSALEPPSQVVIANVAGLEIGEALSGWIGRTWGLQARFAVTAASDFGVTNAYAFPQQMGVDRWVELVGARAGRLAPCCIVDCGTAITIDALSSAGLHLGGVIFPGVRLMRESLYRDTRRIPPEESGQITYFGQSTRDCVWGGTTYAVATSIDGITRRMETEMGGQMQRVLTGGDAGLLLPYLQDSYRLEPDLLFHGLLVMAGQSAPTA